MVVVELSAVAIGVGIVLAVMGIVQMIEKE